MLSVCPAFRLLKWLAQLSEIYYGSYGIRGYPNFVPLHLL